MIWHPFAVGFRVGQPDILSVELTASFYSLRGLITSIFPDSRHPVLKLRQS